MLCFCLKLHSLKCVHGPLHLSSLSLHIFFFLGGGGRLTKNTSTTPGRHLGIKLMRCLDFTQLLSHQWKHPWNFSSKRRRTFPTKKGPSNIGLSCKQIVSWNHHFGEGLLWYPKDHWALEWKGLNLYSWRSGSSKWPVLRGQDTYCSSSWESTFGAKSEHTLHNDSDSLINTYYIVLQMMYNVIKCNNVNNDNVNVNLTNFKLLIFQLKPLPLECETASKGGQALAHSMSFQTSFVSRSHICS